MKTIKEQIMADSKVKIRYIVEMKSTRHNKDLWYRAYNTRTSSDSNFKTIEDARHFVKLEKARAKRGWLDMMFRIVEVQTISTVVE
jgi:hypothetical protein